MPTLKDWPQSPLSLKGYPRRDPYVSCEKVKDEAVLYDPLREQVFALNHSAYLIWQKCDGTTSVEDMVTELSETFTITYEQLTEQVLSILDNFKQLGLLADLHSSRALYVVRIQHGNHQVLVYTDSQEVEKNISQRFAAMLGTEEGPVAGQLGIYKTPKGYTVTGAKIMHVSNGNLSEAIRAVKHECVLRFLEAQPEYIWLHAGGIALDKGAIALAGPWGAGKSTLVSSLYQNGWSYLSDDILPLDIASFEVHPFPLTPATRYNPEPDSPLPVSLLPKKLTLLEPGTICTSPQPVRAFIFPRYDPEAFNTLVACSPSFVAVELIKHCQNLDYHKEEGVKLLCSLASQVPGFTLHYSDGQEAASKIETWYATVAT